MLAAPTRRSSGLSQGDPELFAVIFDRHADEIHQYAARRLGEQAAPDVVSDVFLAAFRNRGRYDPARADARPWLYGIATKVISQHLRGEGRRVRALAAIRPPAPAELSVEEISDRITAAQLRPRLPCAQRLLPDGKWSRAPLTSLGCYPGSRQSACPQGYLGHLPGTVRGMRKFLLRNGWHPSGTAAFGIISGIENVSWERGLLVPNRSYALMFRAAAHAPGIFLIPHAVNVAGRPGIGVAVCIPPGPGRVLGSAKGVTTRPPGCHARIELIFSARTYELIGEQNAGPGGRPQHGQGAAALLRTAVVSRLGQLP
jgi:hypothetical protein